VATGVLLMTFGSAETSAGVPEYLRSVRGGTEPSSEVVAEFKRRYDLIGRSPLGDITDDQAESLQLLLDAEHGAGKFHVEVGMLHSAPRINDAVGTLCRHGSDEILGIILAPQYSEQIMAGYPAALNAAGVQHGITVRIAKPWYMLESLHVAMAEKVRAGLAALEPNAPVVFTAHSLPRRVVDRDPEYLDTLRETAKAIAASCELPGERWHFAYQSAGHTPEEWLRPDFTELLPGLHDAGHEEVLVVPTQFVADHLEVLYDIDIAGTKEAAELGMTMKRSEMLNASPRFIRALASVVAREVTVVTV
jgi:protoporphyrin/coproporphyrin ferrochelatase